MLTRSGHSDLVAFVGLVVGVAALGGRLVGGLLGGSVLAAASSAGVLGGLGSGLGRPPRRVSSPAAGAGAAAAFFERGARSCGVYASVTSSMTAMGALSPLRGPILVIRV